ncbi:hypothetical protein HDU76_008664, partial [Blyttiomyces sp. JEL0837]
MNFAALACLLFLSLITRSLAQDNSDLIADLDPNVQTSPYTCYNGSNKYGWENFTAYAASHRTIVLEYDEWDSANIATRLLQFVLTDVLGFKVEIGVYGGGGSTLPRLADGHFTDIAMELWPSDQADNYHQLVTVERKVIDFGPIGYTGRIGLYVPNYAIDAHPLLDIDFWRFLQNPDGTSLFLKSGQGPTLLQDDGTPWCDGLPKGCSNGTYKPAWYSDENANNFVEIWHVSSGYSTYVFERMIDGLHLNATINYLGDPQDQYVKWAIGNQTNIIFYYWKPTTFISSLNVTRLTFPDDSRGFYSKFEKGMGSGRSVYILIAPIAPWYQATSSKFVEDFPDLVSLIQRFIIDDFNIDKMLSYMAENQADEIDTACTWFLANEPIWRQWLPSTPQKFEYCPAGFGLFEKDQVSFCLVCPKDFYNWDPHNENGCNVCPDEAVCPGGDMVNVKSGYWLPPREASESLVPTFYKCPFEESCCP